MPAAVGAEFDFGWMINHVMSMTDAEIASELGLRHRNKSLLFTVWAPGLDRGVHLSPSSLEVQIGQSDSIVSAASTDKMKSSSPSPTSSKDNSPEISPLSSPDSKPASPPLPPPILPSPLPIPDIGIKKRCVDTKIKFCFKSSSSAENKNDKIKKPRTQVLNKDIGGDKPSDNSQRNLPQMPIDPAVSACRPQITGVDPTVSACLNSVLSTEEPVEQQEKHEQWHKVTHSRRQGLVAGSGSAGRGRGRGIDSSKIKPLIPGLVGGVGKTNLTWLQHSQPKAKGRGRGRGHLGQNSQYQTQQGPTGQIRQGVNSKASTEGLSTPPAAAAESSEGAAKQMGNIHGKPQHISVITANRNRKKKKNTSIAFDNGLKFRL